MTSRAVFFGMRLLDPVTHYGRGDCAGIRSAAFAGLSENPPDIAILDVKMPKMDGMELLRKLRQTSNLPAIFLTSKDDEIDEVVGFNIGADDFIRKPCSTRLLGGGFCEFHCQVSRCPST